MLTGLGFLGLVIIVGVWIMPGEVAGDRSDTILTGGNVFQTPDFHFHLYIDPAKGGAASSARELVESLKRFMWSELEFDSKTGREAFAPSKYSEPYLRDTYGVAVLIVRDQQLWRRRLHS
ncbi:MAG: hypothetical protein ACK4TP_07330 [Hyphomicrobium sp.]